MVDLKAFADASVSGIPLVVFVLALTTWVADVISAQGKRKMIVAMVIGLLFGGAYQVSQNMPTSFAGWFLVLVYGISLGLLASGVWDTGKTLFLKVLERFEER